MNKCKKCRDKIFSGCVFCNPNYVSPSVYELLEMNEEIRNIHIDTQFEHSLLVDFEIFEDFQYDELDFDDGYINDLETNNGY